MAAHRRHDEADAAAELKAWSMTFKSGHDYLRALTPIGIAINEWHQPAREVAAEAWQRLGAAFLERRPPDEPVEPWALRTFGDPRARPLPVRRGRRR